VRKSDASRNVGAYRNSPGGIPMSDHEFKAGDYWLGPDDELLMVEDHPTDGVLFFNLDEEEEEFIELQVPEEDIEEENFRRIHVDSDDVQIVVKVEMSGVDHKFIFGRHFDGDAWPSQMIQQGESYNPGLGDIPEFVRFIVRDEIEGELTQK
jgi:hypothetical protein